MPRFVRQSNLKQLLRSRTVTVTLLLVAVGVSLAAGRELARRVSVQRELERLQRDISQTEQSTRDLEQLIATLKSVTYQEGAARTRLNVQKPGEKVIVVPGSNVQPDLTVPTEDQAETTSQPAESNTHRWWNFFFNHSSS